MKVTTNDAKLAFNAKHGITEKVNTNEIFTMYNWQIKKILSQPNWNNYFKVKEGQLMYGGLKVFNITKSRLAKLSDYK